MIVADSPGSHCPPLAFERVSLVDDDNHGRQVSDATSFTLNAGELACLAGPPCKGAKTFLRLASGNSRPASGEVRLCGMPAELWSPAELARRVRLLMPSARLFIGCTISEVLEAHIEPEGANTRSGRPAQLELARLALAQAGIVDAGKRHWSRLASVERQGVRLSLLLARLWSLPESTRLVIVDDYLDNIPTHLATQTFSALRDFARQRNAGVIATAHRVPLDGQPIDRLIPVHHGQEQSCAITSELPEQRFH